MEHALLRKLLEEAGYTTVFRRQAWTECLISARLERWVGRGADEAEALADALRQMLPSRAAERLFQWWCAAQAPGAEERPRVAPEAAEPAREVTTALAARGASRSDGLAALQVLAERIDAERGELAMMTPLRQRMVMLSWICQARVWEDRRPGDTFVARQVAGIARKITLLGKVWWPGSVRSLHVHSTPVDAVAEAGMEASWAPRDWEAATDLVDKRVAALVAADEAAGRDEYGWPDEEALEPPPERPDAVLEALARTLREQSGPLEEQGHPNARAAIADGTLDPARVAGWVRLLRWLRGATADFDTWGAVAGRLRWMALQLGGRGSAAAEALDPDYLPEAPWAQLAAGAADPAAPGQLSEASATGLLRTLRARTAGKRAVVFGLGLGPELAPRLEAALGLQVTLVDATPPLSEATLRALEERPPDVVVAVTRFAAFPADVTLSQACRKGRVPYVRLHGGQAVALARALRRELGA